MNANTNTAASFTLDSLSINGKTFPAQYSISPTGTVYAFVTIQEGGKPVNLRVKIDPSEAAYGAALAAAQQEKQAHAAPVAQAEPAQKPEPVQDAPSAPASVPEKAFIGQTIQGTGWRIVFDGAASRTRVILQDDAPEAMREAVQAAGFYWSKPLASFNKKLTFKAYRAAQALAQQLHAIHA